MPEACTHLDQIRITETDVRVCAECVRMGSPWVHLRACLVCGQVGCCDESPNRHATAHFRRTTHPLARSVEPGENWAWCYVDKAAFILSEETSP